LNIGEDMGGKMRSPSSARRRSSPWNGASGHFLVWLETFRVVVSTRHFTSAAVQLGYTQSTVTTHIKALERQLGVTLFERFKGSQNIILTEAGRGAFKYASRLLALADEMKAAAQGPYKEGDLIDA
jgi:DNA-binding transcriptional LysR family regulator